MAVPLLDHDPPPPDEPASMSGEPDLRHHGDRDTGAGLVDLAVNVRRSAPPPWLTTVLTEHLAGLASYPETTAATGAVARRHGRSTTEVLVTAGGAEAFTLLARALRPRVDVHRAVVVHPQFTEPEVALTVAGHVVERVVLRAEEGFVLDPAGVPADADLVVVGNPTNPTSVLHPAAVLAALARPGRVLVVDEAFMDAVPGEPESLAARILPGVVVVRSLTKTWGLAGLRAGYLLGPAGLVRRLGEVQPPWSVSSLALAATAACCAPDAVAQGEDDARASGRDRAHLVAALGALAPVAVAPQAPFVLIQLPGGERVRTRLRQHGFAVRRGDSFPGLGSDWLRIAVRDRDTTDAFVAALRKVLAG
jgi:histidinol-phosphate aminotransferase